MHQRPPLQDEARSLTPKHEVTMRLNEQGFRMLEGLGEGRNQEAAPILRESTVVYEYRELPHRDGGRLDVLEQLKANIQHIEELNGKLSYLLSEVKSVIRK